jgi:hypothetical protein
MIPGNSAGRSVGRGWGTQCLPASKRPSSAKVPPPPPEANAAVHFLSMMVRARAWRCNLRLRTAPAIRPKRDTVQERIGASYGADENTVRTANVVSPEKAYCIAVLGSISWIP